MTGIRPAIDDYLSVRRSLGYKLEDHEWLLVDFVCFLEEQGATTVTTQLALDWATLPQDVLPSWWAARLRVVRGSRTISRRSILPPRSHRSACWLAATGERCPTCTRRPMCAH